jgi:hypothetical protein
VTTLILASTFDAVKTVEPSFVGVALTLSTYYISSIDFRNPEILPIPTIYLMSFEESPWLSLTTLDNSDLELVNSRSCNPFRDSSSFPDNERTISRRRAHSLSKKSNDLSITKISGHSRSKTEFGVQHPLRSAAPLTSDDAGVTRPHLERMVGIWDSATSSQADEDSWLDESERDLGRAATDIVDERVVLVHEVLFFSVGGIIQFV